MTLEQALYAVSVISGPVRPITDGGGAERLGIARQAHAHHAEHGGLLVDSLALARAEWLSRYVAACESP